VAIDKEIAAVIDRPMTAPSGHLGEWVVTGIFHVGRAQPAVAVATEPRRSSDRALIRTERPAFELSVHAERFPDGPAGLVQG